MNRADFQNLAAIRLVEAEALLASGNYSGAYYLAGYVVECALKACIARSTREYDFPPPARVVQEIYTHDLVRLIRSAGLQADLDAHRAAAPTFSQSWLTVTDWSEQARYGTYAQAEADELIQAINDPLHGVLSWLQRYW